MKRAVLGLLCASALLLGGCGYVAPVVPPGGLFYSNVKAPIDVDAATTAMSSKSGSSESASVLGLFAWGDASITSAAQNGGLSTVNHVDYEYFNVLFIYQKFTTKVYGE